MNQPKNSHHKKKRPRTKLPSTVIDNIPEGIESHLSGQTIFQFFQKELMEKFCKHPDGTPYKFPKLTEEIGNLKNIDSDTKKS